MIVSLIGSSTHNIDSKNRLSIPAEFRRWSDEESCIFVVSRGVDPCLVVHPSMEWDVKVEKMIRSLSPYDRKHNAFIRANVVEAKRLRCDKQGRILIPQILLDNVGIKKEVKIIGMVDHLEIWNIDTYKNYDTSNFTPDDEYFSGLSELLK